MEKNIDFTLEHDLSVKGFVGIREIGSTTEAGFALFRRGRVIEGSFDSGFRPEEIFGTPNSFRYQRVFGELHLEGFKVSFTKKGVQWDENLEIFLEILKDDLSHDSFPLLIQAEKYRTRANDKDYRNSGVKALSHTVADFEKVAPKAIHETFEQSILSIYSDSELPQTDKRIFKTFKVNFNKIDWHISIELSYDTSIKELFEVGPYLMELIEEYNVRQVGIRLSLIHPFMIQYVGTENSKLEPILKIIASLGLSELIAKESGAKTQGEIRRNFNKLISTIFQI
ncbi:hypothetical protein [Flectobacillus sp. BAB-3569]|uniref:hypothetical protein n=1 Tax=Flectobacillus sp. BAB-3569 TaxID=1509483 RepID=UPI001C3C3F30|nr:hypothetical protein [Flectobacillus sp. BAB-3569]